MLNVHPFLFSINLPSMDTTSASGSTYQRRDRQHRSDPPQGRGTRDVFRQLLSALVGSGERFATLGELYRLQAEPALPTTEAARTILVGPDVAQRGRPRAIPSLSDSEKQEFVRREFEERNPTDPYATSRDYNMRELEIEAIARQLETRPPARARPGLRQRLH